MRLKELRVANLRVLEDVALELAPGWNTFIGDNGAGKTSVLEAVFLLTHGRSFRNGARDALSRIGSSGFAVYANVQRSGGLEHRLGLARIGNRLEARVGGEPATLSELVQRAAALCFEPGSHELISGGAELRRRAVDWGVFHVEHAFVQQWRRYQRALKQRNVCLRSGTPDEVLEPWEIEMAETGQQISTFRTHYVEQLRPHITEFLDTFLPELGAAVFSFEQGWDSEKKLIDVMQQNRQKDRERGYTTRGPHRADWSLTFSGAPRREHLSRGQEKLCALAIGLAQARCYAETHDEWPILCFDDMAAELDRGHQQRLISAIQGSGAQVLITGTELDRIGHPDGRVFHVEQGSVQPLV